MSWANSRKSLAEKQIESMTVTLPESFTSTCVPKSTMLTTMKGILESTESSDTRKVHEPEAQRVIKSVDTTVQAIETYNKGVGASKPINITELKKKLDEIKNGSSTQA